MTEFVILMMKQRLHAPYDMYLPLVNCSMTTALLIMVSSPNLKWTLVLLPLSLFSFLLLINTGSLPTNLIPLYLRTNWSTVTIISSVATVFGLLALWLRYLFIIDNFNKLAAGLLAGWTYYFLSNLLIMHFCYSAADKSYKLTLITLIGTSTFWSAAYFFHYFDTSQKPKTLS